MANTHTFSKGEEVANSITHGVGILFSLTALVLLIVYSSLVGTAWHVVSFTIFGFTMLLMYTSSTLLHAFPEGSKVKDLFEVFDHSSIYFFIAGTYTPYMFTVVEGALGWTIFGIVWGMAIGGTVFKAFFVKKFLFTSTVLYVLMGWLIILAWGPLIETLQPSGLAYLVVGGLLYTLGAVFYVWRGFKFHHAVWHLFVIAGSVLHFLSVMTLLE
ncbi:PAQR family membrane homeostasis protein TrhA [Lentibacillus amyloliquefaciens]|uniref:Hemolysin D n=1 Tax=Lentibacillus amyloliquefaciens TaxID=1472767 RepID=A0A0U4FJ38_9BACI|nr:hemolysin III family protein [Lentibacillus amyloliquefaciens]ALX50573.1 hemolysin D [Lentibacillus amyloliquefaciens]